jgi:hypothetical protein
MAWCLVQQRTTLPYFLTFPNVGLHLLYIYTLIFRYDSLCEVSWWSDITTASLPLQLAELKLFISVVESHCRKWGELTKASCCSGM